MASLNRLAPLLFASAFAAASWALPVSAQSDSRAVAQCRTEALRQFPAETIRSHRIASISGNSRRTRVSLTVTTDRRYSFECVADAQGRIVTAAWDPPVSGGIATAQGQ